jgi:hypothetical protein
MFGFVELAYILLEVWDIEESFPRSHRLSRLVLRFVVLVYVDLELQDMMYMSLCHVG